VLHTLPCANAHSPFASVSLPALPPCSPELRIVMPSQTPPTLKAMHRPSRRPHPYNPSRLAVRQKMLASHAAIVVHTAHSHRRAPAPLLSRSITETTHTPIGSTNLRLIHDLRLVDTRRHVAHVEQPRDATVTIGPLCHHRCGDRQRPCTATIHRRSTSLTVRIRVRLLR
jgi:hypothetical protein